MRFIHNYKQKIINIINSFRSFKSIKKQLIWQYHAKDNEINIRIKLIINNNRHELIKYNIIIKMKTINDDDLNFHQWLTDGHKARLATQRPRLPTTNKEADAISSFSFEKKKQKKIFIGFSHFQVDQN